MFVVYILRSKKDGSFYTGFTNDLQRRLNEHNGCQNQSTKGRVPFEVVYKEQCATRTEARAREKFLKSGIGREFRDSVIESNIPA